MKFSAIFIVAAFAASSHALSMSHDSMYARSGQLEIVDFSTRELVEALEARMDLDRRGKGLFRKIATAVLGLGQNKVNKNGNHGSSHSGASGHVSPAVTDTSLDVAPVDPTTVLRRELGHKILSTTSSHGQEKVSGGSHGGTTGSTTGLRRRLNY